MITYDHGVMEIDTKLWLEENAYYCVLAGDECTPDSSTGLSQTIENM